MKIRSLAALAVLVSLSAVPAHAGPFGDEMSKCLVRTTSDTDKTVLMQWIFVAMTAHPDVSAFSKVSGEQGEELNKKVANLFVTLLTQRCKSETEQAIKYEGARVLETSFAVLGQVAMQGIMTDPAVSAYISRLQQHVDTKAIEKTFTAKK